MSLRENIAFNDRVTEESLQKAIDTAELNDFIETLPQKLETIVSERGTSLSGGQKQRIMLARALAINPKILLLDDFISRVDNKTENAILCNLQTKLSRPYPDIGHPKDIIDTGFRTDHFADGRSRYCSRHPSATETMLIGI